MAILRTDVSSSQYRVFRLTGKSGEEEILCASRNRRGRSLVRQCTKERETGLEPATACLEGSLS